MSFIRRSAILLAGGLLAMGLAACASRDTPRTAQDALAGSRQDPAVVAACYDEFGQPLQPHPANPALSGDPRCHAPRETVVRRSRSPQSRSSDPVLEEGTISLPRTPVPVPGGIGVFR
jgi:hypothetical protein